MTPAAGPEQTGAIHAGCVVLGSAGVLIRGPSGSGKSSLALALIEAWRQRGRFAALVSDDRVHLMLTNDRLIATAPQTIGGLIEQRGRGIRSLPMLSRAVVRLVIDLLPEADLERMPGPAMLTVSSRDVLAGTMPVTEGVAGHADRPDTTADGDIALPRQPVPQASIAIAMPLVQAALCDPDGQSGRFFT